MTLPQRIFLSPHPDDIAYSCYGSIQNPPVPNSNSALIVTVFNIGRTAPALPGHQKNQAEISKIRQAEDEAFARTEGCRVIFLNHPDSAVRGEPNEGPQESRHDSTYHPIFHSVKETVLNSIQAAVGHASIFVPLGIRDHIDHRIVRDVAMQIIAEANIPNIESSLIYYEDLPYAAFVPEHQIRRLARTIISPTVRPIDVHLKTIWARKKSALQLYASQVTPFTRDTIIQYASQLGGSSFTPVERLWVYDPLKTRPKVDVMSWVTWEAARRVGGYTTLFKHVFESTKFQKVVGRTILMGPLHMPMICPEYDPMEDIESIANTLGCSILYPSSLMAGPTPLHYSTVEAFRNIEKRYGIGLFYLRDKGNTHSHAVDRILFDLSNVVDQKDIFMSSLPQFCQDLKERMNLSIEMEVRRRSTINGTIHNDHHFGSNEDCQVNVWKKNLSNRDPSFFAHKDCDSIYGMLIAQPVADCLSVLVEPDETAVLIATEELSLPAAFAAQLARDSSCRQSGPLIKTMFYSGDVHPIRNLTTGAVLPDIPTLYSLSGFDFECPIRLLIDLCLKDLVKPNSGHLLSYYNLLDFVPLQDIGNHMNAKIMQHGWKADAVTVTSTKVLDELLFLNPDFATIKDIPVISPGVSIISCNPRMKELCRAKLIAYAKMSWGFDDLTAENTIIATQIARAVTPKGFLRTLHLAQELSLQLRKHGLEEIKVLCIFVTSWNEDCVRVGDYRMIDELLKALGGTTSLNEHNLYVKVINQTRWPVVAEHGHLPTRMTREDLHRATDVSMCLSLYDTFAIAPLEPMSCGAIAVVSTGCGCSRKIIEFEDWQTNVIIVDYIEEWAKDLTTRDNKISYEELSTIFSICREDKLSLESSTHKKLALQLFRMLPRTAAQRAMMIETGRKLAAKLNWEDLFSAPFEKVITDMFSER